ncbi:hypothetical protein EW146_g10387, partial [Bondarzewia mesenterica]
MLFLAEPSLRFPTTSSHLDIVPALVLDAANDVLHFHSIPLCYSRQPLHDTDDDTSSDTPWHPPPTSHSAGQRRPQRALSPPYVPGQMRRGTDSDDSSESDVDEPFLPSALPTPQSHHRHYPTNPPAPRPRQPPSTSDRFRALQISSHPVNPFTTPSRVVSSTSSLDQNASAHLRHRGPSPANSDSADESEEYMTRNDLARHVRGRRDLSERTTNWDDARASPGDQYRRANRA